MWHAGENGHHFNHFPLSAREWWGRKDERCHTYLTSLTMGHGGGSAVNHGSSGAESKSHSSPECDHLLSTPSFGLRWRSERKLPLGSRQGSVQSLACHEWGPQGLWPASPLYLQRSIKTQHFYGNSNDAEHSRCLFICWELQRRMSQMCIGETLAAGIHSSTLVYPLLSQASSDWIPSILYH